MARHWFKPYTLPKQLTRAQVRRVVLPTLGVAKGKPKMRPMPEDKLISGNPVERYLKLMGLNKDEADKRAIDWEAYNAYFKCGRVR